MGPSGKVVLADINASMLRVGRDKLMDNGVGGNVEYVQANAECLPFPDNSFDCITIAFGLRNVTDKDAALRSMARVLKPGGRLAVISFHSIEDRFVKHWLKANLDVVTKKPITATPLEARENPRSRSANPH